jgi:hypothetical protein
MNCEDEPKIASSEGFNREVTPSIPVAAEKSNDSNDSNETKRADYERSKKIALRKYGL